MSNAEEVQKLLGAQEIGHLKSRYCRYIDTKQWEALRTIFAAEARFEGFVAAPNGSGVREFVDGVSRRLANSVTVHHCHMPEIVFLTSDSARAVWAMMDYCEWPTPIALPEAPKARGFSGYGYYEEEYRRIDGTWKIQFVRLTRQRVDPLVEGPNPARAGSLALSAEWTAPSRDWLNSVA